ncbi:MAG: hypothetical protein KKH88_00660 [Nanoarchaeota archaeon]|nr:hypothetical protein [Nanoarchaeota archaeon]
MQRLGKIEEVRKTHPDLAGDFSFWFHELVYYDWHAKRGEKWPDCVRERQEQIHRVRTQPSAQYHTPQPGRQQQEVRTRTIFDEMRDEAMRTPGMGFEPDWDYYDYACELERKGWLYNCSD